MSHSEAKKNASSTEWYHLQDMTVILTATRHSDGARNVDYFTTTFNLNDISYPLANCWKIPTQFNFHNFPVVFTHIVL